MLHGTLSAPCNPGCVVVRKCHGTQQLSNARVHTQALPDPSSGRHVAFITSRKKRYWRHRQAHELIVACGKMQLWCPYADGEIVFLGIVWLHGREEHACKQPSLAQHFGTWTSSTSGICYTDIDSAAWRNTKFEDGSRCLLCRKALKGSTRSEVRFCYLHVDDKRESRDTAGHRVAAVKINFWRTCDMTDRTMKTNAKHTVEAKSPTACCMCVTPQYFRNGALVA